MKTDLLYKVTLGLPFRQTFGGASVWKEAN